MPKFPQHPTHHTRRNEVVRERARKAVAGYDDVPGITKYGQFTRDVMKMAEQHGIHYSKAKYPKDNTSSMGKWLEGKQHMTFARLDAIELTCMTLEQERAMAPVAQQEPTPTLEPVVPAPSPTHYVANGDPELIAIAEVLRVLDPLDYAGRKRVFTYVNERLDQ
jgi:hypothetical protein